MGERTPSHGARVRVAGAAAVVAVLTAACSSGGSGPSPHENGRRTTVHLVPVHTVDAATASAAADILRHRLSGAGITANVSVHGQNIDVVTTATAVDVKQLLNPGAVAFRAVLLCADANTPTASGPIATPAPPTGAPTAPTPPATAQPAAAVASPSAGTCFNPVQQDTGAPPTYPATLTGATSATAPTLTVPADVYQRYEHADCARPATLDGYDPATGTVSDPDPAGTREVVACDASNATKYLLARAAIHGTDLRSAHALQRSDTEGDTTGAWYVDLTLTNRGSATFAAVTGALAPGRNQVAIALDNVVRSAPTVNQAITGGQVEISGGEVTAASARALANVLSYGTLPVEYRITTGTGM